jgi:hypothetical protein
MTLDPQAAGGRILKGHQIAAVSPADRDAHQRDGWIHGRVYHDMLVSPPVRLGAFAQPRLVPQLAVVLAADLPAGASPGAAQLAMGGAFLALEVSAAPAGAFLVGERLLSLSLAGGRLVLYVDAELVAETSAEDSGQLGDRIGRLADDVGGLRAGQLVFAAAGDPAAAAPARPGMVELRGPEHTMITALVQA